jgi:hypothetical protein
MKDTAKEMKKVPHLDLRHLRADQQDKERERLYKLLENQRDQLGEELERTRRRVRHSHSNMRGSPPPV